MDLRLRAEGTILPPPPRVWIFPQGSILEPEEVFFSPPPIQELKASRGSFFLKEKGNENSFFVVGIDSCGEPEGRL